MGPRATASWARGLPMACLADVRSLEGEGEAWAWSRRTAQA